MLKFRYLQIPTPEYDIATPSLSNNLGENGGLADNIEKLETGKGLGEDVININATGEGNYGKASICYMRWHGLEKK